MLKLCLIGQDIENSKSPKIYKSLASRDEINLSYDLINLGKKDLLGFISKVKKGLYQGFNVTSPYKKEIMKYLDWVSDDALSIDAVNTVYNDDGFLRGYNTDVYGAYKSIGPILNEGSTLILGRGGAARAVISAFKDYDLTVYVRDNMNESLKKIKRDLKFTSKLEGLDFVNVINATNVGFNENRTIIAEPFKSQKTAVDLIYTPVKTKFLMLMENNGIRTKNGYDMLKFQAELSYKIYLGEIK